MTDEAMLDQLQRETFLYFLNEANPHNGLVADKTQVGHPRVLPRPALGWRFIRSVSNVGS